MELVLPMYNAHPYFFLRNLGKKSAHYIWQNTGNWKKPKCNAMEFFFFFAVFYPTGMFKYSFGSCIKMFSLSTLNLFNQ